MEEIRDIKKEGQCVNKSMVGADMEAVDAILAELVYGISHQNDRLGYRGKHEINLLNFG